MCRVFAIMVYQQYVYSLAFICVAHTMSLSINSIPFHYRFAFRSLIIDSFIQSVVCGEGVILFIRYMFCSYGLYHESACYLTIVIPKVVEGEMEMGRGGMDAVILPLFVGYWWCTQTVYPVASLFSFFF